MSFSAPDYKPQSLLFLACLIITALAVIVPFAPAMPGDGLDPSWMFAMNQALAQGMVFGTDIAFTFGPYASLYTKVYHPATDHLMVYGATYWALSFALAVFLNFRNARWQIQFGLLLALCTIIYSPDALLFFYPMLAGVYVYQSIATKRIDALGNRTLALILLALFAPFGLLPLIKGSALIACIAIALLSAFLLLKSGRRQFAAAVCLIPMFAMAAFWLAASQPLLALPQYFHAMLPIISGYTEAMAVNGKPQELLYFSIAAAILVCSVYFNQAAARWLRVTVTLIFMCILFLAFKAGFVRHDAHAVISGTMLLLAAFLASTLIASSRAFNLLLIAVAAWAYIDASQIKTSTQTIIGNFSATYAKAWTGVRARISDAASLQNEFNQRIAEFKARGAIPALDGTVDIYSYDQSYLIASGNKWNPRPILQSYSAYTPALAEMNKNHLLAANRPDNILFKVQPIDDRLPALEEGVSWPVLISDYEPTSFANGYLLLKHRQAGHQLPIKAVGIERRSSSFGERIDLPQTNKVLYARIKLKKSLSGAFLNTLFKPSKLEIQITLANGTVKRYRMIASMAESGFVVSPLIENTADFGLLYAGAGTLKDKQISSITVQPTKYRALWRDSFEVELSNLEYATNQDVIALYGLIQPMDREPLGALVTANKCDGSIDSANGISPAPAQLVTGAVLNVNGWLAPSADQGELPEKTYLMLSNEKGQRYFIATHQSERPDVGAYFKKPQLKQSGYFTTADLSKLGGDYFLGLAYAKGNTLYMCPQFKVKTHIAQ